MNDKTLLVNAIESIFYGYGGLPQPESVNGVNDILTWYEKLTNKTIGIRFEQDPRTLNITNYSDVINKL